MVEFIAENQSTKPSIQYQNVQLSAKSGPLKYKKKLHSAEEDCCDRNIGADVRNVVSEIVNDVVRRHESNLKIREEFLDLNESNGCVANCDNFESWNRLLGDRSHFHDTYSHNVQLLGCELRDGTQSLIDTRTNFSVKEEPLDLSLPCKKPVKIKKIGIKYGAVSRRRENHGSQKLYHKYKFKKSAKRYAGLSRYLRKLEKFGKEFDFSYVAPHPLTNQQKVNCHVDAYKEQDRELYIHKYFKNIEHLMKVPLFSRKSGQTGLVDHLNTKQQTYEKSSVKVANVNTDKHTLHKCTCGLRFHTVVELSRHMRKSGHKSKSYKSYGVRDYQKLVRGQDVWLNRGIEQTRQILRCIQCGESFRSLPELTVHMMDTRHYQNIVNGDQLKRGHLCSAYCEHNGECVFKCKVCDRRFGDMESLASHMVQSGHHLSNPTSELPFKKQKMKDICQREKRNLLSPINKRPCSTGIDAKRITVGDKRLPNDQLYKMSSTSDICLLNNKNTSSSGVNYTRSDHNIKHSNPNGIESENYINCETCSRSIKMTEFVSHIRSCVKSSECNLKKHSPIDFTNDLKDNSKFSEFSPDNKGLMNGHWSPINSLKHNMANTTLSGALEAMENFINSSFNRKDHVASKNPVRSHSISNLASSIPINSSSKNKFIDRQKTSNNHLIHQTSNYFNEESGSSLPSHDCDVSNSEEVLIDDKIKSDLNSKSSSISYQKYLVAEDVDEKLSALESLSSFVYGQQLTSEHPLDRLDKLRGTPQTATPVNSKAHSQLTSPLGNFSSQCSNESKSYQGFFAKSHQSHNYDQESTIQSPKSSHKLYCATCKVAFVSPQTLALHLISSPCSRLPNYNPVTFDSLKNIYSDYYNQPYFYSLPFAHSPVSGILTSLTHY